MFGRTAVGKSSLIEALTRGDAATASPGESDRPHRGHHSRAVGGDPLARRHARNASGGAPVDREELEARTEAGVSRADLVVLAFGSQNQQVAEFERAT
jgi:predicted GTPase